jgi:hypothetical protein
MHDRALHQFRDAIRHRDYIMTTHADEEMWQDGLTIHDVENAILTGEIVERQRDRESAESKYLVRGDSLEGQKVVVVTKSGHVHRLVIITVYLE